MALFMGALLGLSLGSPYSAWLGKVTQYTLQASVVGLGFGINLHQVASTGTMGFFYTALSLAFTMLLGALLAKVFKVDKRLNYLISTGTAICGGSAIAAISPAIKASEKEMSVALGIVFVLNAVALFLFPIVGELLELSQQQFGTWAAIAIHDTSSVVGAATLFGEEALEVGATLKLTRALWILPLVLITGYMFKSAGAKSAFPVFIFLFLLASLVSTFMPDMEAFYSLLIMLARKGLIVSLFLTGSAVNLALVKTISIRPFLLGLVLWLLVAATSLAGVCLFIE